VSSDEAGAARQRLSRRSLLGAAAAGTAGLVVGGVARPLILPWPAAPPDPVASAGSAGAAPTMYPFFGAHQAGIATPAQEHLQIAAFDMIEGTNRRDLVRLLRDWSEASARMTKGLEATEAGALDGDPQSPPEDTGEAMGLAASGLTVTIGFGPGLFGTQGSDRFELAAARPPELEPLPLFKGDALQERLSHGDLCVQVCADDPQVAFHAIRNLARIAIDTATIRWSQPGFGRTSRTTTAQQTPRNLLGFKDGTNNLVAEDTAGLDEHVWVARGDTPAWLAAGSYLIVRKIEMFVEDWDREPLFSQESIFGRSKGNGAPLSGGEEFTAPDFAALVDGKDAIDIASHVRLAHPSNNGGVRILRRGFNYVGGIHPNGLIDAGLVFIAYQRSPGQFIAIQQALATDKLNDYIKHVGSAIYAVPPGASEGGFVGETLLG
jgi:deferrochelatase/peroxidase EfeB